MYIQVKDILANPEAFAAAAPAAAAPAAAEPAKKVRMQHNNELLCFCSDPAADKSVKKEVVGTGQGGLPRLCQLQSQGCTAYWVWGFSRGRPWSAWNKSFLMGNVAGGCTAVVGRIGCLIFLAL
eukprot:scaffold69694_cov20-Tisochrysis_lutea.AAC.1